MSGILNPVRWFQHGKIILMLSIASINIPLFAQRDGSYWNAHLAILDMRTRAVSTTAYVREIRLRNFQDADSLPHAFGFGADLFADNGESFDQKANDGVYTSKRCYVHHPGQPFVADEQPGGPLGFVLVGTDFKHTDALIATYAAYGVQRPGPGALALRVIRCKLKLCACPSPCLCFACEWDQADWCLDWTDCQEAIEINW